MAFDRFNDKPARRENRFSDRGPRQDRFGDKREFGDRKDFGERRSFGDRKPFDDRNFSGDRFSDRGGDGFRSREGGRFSERSRDDRPRFGGDRPKFGGRRDAGNFDFAKRSGPRAKAFEVRKHSDRNAFVQTATVRLDADVAEFFKSPEAVNAALRQVIALADLIRPVQAKEAQEENAEVTEKTDDGDESQEGLTATSAEDEE